MSKEKEIRGESFIYKYLTCIVPIKSIIVHARNTNIPIYCRTPFTDALTDGLVFTCSTDFQIFYIDFQLSIVLYLTFGALQIHGNVSRIMLFWILLNVLISDQKLIKFPPKRCNPTIFLLFSDLTSLVSVSKWNYQNKTGYIS